MATNALGYLIQV